MTRHLRIGLTGGIASGKSTAANRFRELGVPVIDADESARAVVHPGSAGLARVVNAFGPGVLSSTGELDRRALRDLIFADPVRRRELESLLHPMIHADMDARSDSAVGPYIVLAIPLLVESGRLDRVDRILVIDAEERAQRERLMARDGTSAEQADAILQAQASRSARLAAAHDVLKNDGSLLELRRGIDQLHQRYLGLAEDFAVRDETLT